MMEQSTAETIADGIERQLDPRWIPVQRILSAILTVIIAGVSFVCAMSLWAASGILLLGLLLLPVWAMLMAALAWQLQRWPAVSYRFSSYRVDQAGIEIRQGVYWRIITNVPRSRVQHTDVSQGPLERRFGLGTLVIYTAGTSHSRVNVSGLAFDVARRIRAHLLPDDQSDAV
ncbi:MAG TPA: PH domain-containing protein [Vicinamibacterales bacterium]|nr:PH domain-containing protein [Vicinamibacterales bacterium]